MRVPKDLKAQKDLRIQDLRTQDLMVPKDLRAQKR